LPILSSCGDKGQEIKYSSDNELGDKVSYDLPRFTITTPEVFDTVTVQNTEELIKHLRSNRVIHLGSNEYPLTTTLLIDSIENLNIIGTGSSRLIIVERNSTVLKLSNSSDIHLDSLVIGHRGSPGHNGEHGVLRVVHSNDINISNCKLLGAGTFGLVTYDTYNLKFTNSEITECTALIFELEKSRRIEFTDSKFHNNDLAISVLGGFTNSTKKVSFLNCDFVHNRPKMPGNPAFNFMGNSKNLDERIVFTNCLFKNNEGFKWYGDKIELNDCKVDSTGFVNFSGSIE